ncbi:hypothetical protein PsAD2_04541 [Pseudovibrio axinellae]|uniref:Uncharacterized protein n=1 Tax=Pseudovibrio axinellae TaxID=989403 RepID=A0A165T1X0_9HYPH|nr:hypothetical protein [Pseudovibrio axinellae]KZL05186.1 hypothetical protein PsAD2_04541 [Pseudovibrio axinellae]SER51531.1 hypothetical protein SAMN05421798_111103 [Pseudovibrio axinellae]
MHSVEKIKRGNGCVLHPEVSFFDIGVPDSILNVPGMLSTGERMLLYSLSKRNYRGIGSIIDAGSFMGSSVVASAQGLEDNPLFQGKKSFALDRRKPVNSYELGYLPKPAGGKEVTRNFCGKNYRMGDSFLPILKESIAPHQKLVKLNIGDLKRYKWTGRPIEICFIDVCKTSDLNRHVAQQFMPCLIPAQSYFLNQDFFFDRLPWIKVTMGYLEEYFDWYGQVFSTSIYKCKKQIPADVVAYDPFQEGTLDECLKYHDMHPRAYISDMYRLRMDISRAYLMALKGRKEDALEYLDALGVTYEHVFEEGTAAAETNLMRYQRAQRQIVRGVRKAMA